MNLYSLYWTPDGSSILYNSIRPDSFQPPFRTSYSSVSVDPSNVSIDVHDSCGPLQFVSDSVYTATYCSTCGGDYSFLSLVDTQMGEVIPVWEGVWSNYAVDLEQKLILVAGSDDCENSVCSSDDYGIHLGPFQGEKKKILAGEAGKLFFRGGKQHRFLRIGPDTATGAPGIQGITASGIVESILQGDYQTSISPDFRWLVAYGGDGIVLLEESDQAVFVKKDLRVKAIAWKTNSQGFFYTWKGTWTGKIFYIPVATPDNPRMFECQPGECESGSIGLFPFLIHSSLPGLRAQPPRIAKQTQGTSIWSKAAFQDLFEPGTNEYTVTIPAYSAWRWDFSWCAATKAGLADILAPLEIQFFIDGQEIGEDIFRIHESVKGGQYCRIWATLLSGWQPGDATDLEIRYTLRNAISDGTHKYPAGEYRQVIHIKVAG